MILGVDGEIVLLAASIDPRSVEHERVCITAIGVGGLALLDARGPTIAADRRSREQVVKPRSRAAQAGRRA